jgi:Fe-S-cluster containining protein
MSITESENRPGRIEAERNGSPPWYGDGLRFECRRCNACCGGGPGYVWVRTDEIRRIAQFLGMSPERFAVQHCRRVWNRVSLREMANGDCVMLTPEGCRIYPVRPAQCRSWPFWPDQIDTPAHWERVKDRCPGAGCGHLYTPPEIERIAAGAQDAR